mgnify:CR=1 FL=1|tara:strand:+ start:333 stop:677 length:345 start_codon:yes stop_codon:yes gene_type:complete
MYVRTIKVTFKDKMSKDMFVNYTDTKADEKGINNGTLIKLIFNNSDITATLVLIFPDHKTFMKDHHNLAGPIIDSFKEQGLKIDLNDGEVSGATAVSSDFLKILTNIGTFYTAS